MCRVAFKIKVLSFYLKSVQAVKKMKNKYEYIYIIYNLEQPQNTFNTLFISSNINAVNNKLFAAAQMVTLCNLKFIVILA